jgi:hypothetical protein
VGAERRREWNIIATKSNSHLTQMLIKLLLVAGLVQKIVIVVIHEELELPGN